jgi:anti-sigma regulatory factor (Ser/Thr protein kinase)
VEVADGPSSVTVTMSDSGVPYDPLAKDDPDVTLSAEDRQIGGLGIFLTKKLMDDMSYEYKDGKNILTLRKNV